ncbi:DNA modification methylase [Aestuariivirga sp.]|uniref:DNA modification methylase n=1 Tax=Aestuariivirga sp. TaxID=2650926 RepID=UPI00391AC9F0
MTNRVELTRSNFTGGLAAKSRIRRETMAALASAPDITRSRRNDILPNLTLEQISLSDLKSMPHRTRKVMPAHVREMVGSISTFGFCVPLLIGRENQIIDGEVTLEAARQLGLEKVPAIRVGHLLETEQRALRLAVNRLGEKGEWDLEALRSEFKELVILDAPLEVIGFSLDEIDHVLLNYEEIPGVEPGSLEPERGQRAVARPGDVFCLGPHRVACGDATSPMVWEGLMAPAGALARLVLTDEPYNVPIAGHVSGKGHREFAMASGEMSDVEFLQFNEAWMTEVVGYLADGGVFGTFIDWRGCPIVHKAATALGLVPLNLIVWAKTNGGMGSLYRSQHELLPLFKKGNAPHVNNVELGKRGRYRSNLWTYPGASSLGSDARRGLQDHPTVKPTAMLEDALLDLTNRGDLVLDPFLGSGSTLIAAHSTSRICYGVELDPLYVDVIVRRFEEVTEQLATLSETGETFAALRERRKCEVEFAEGKEGTG